MRWYSAVTVVLAGLVANALQSRAVGSDLQALQGTWTMVSHVADGELVEALSGAVRVVEGKSFEIKKNDQVLRAARIEIDETKQPKWIDITFTLGPEKGKVRRGLYVLGSDTHEICYSELDGKRPMQFASTPGSGHRLVVFKRAATASDTDGQGQHRHEEVGHVVFENPFFNVHHVKLAPGESIARHTGGPRLIYSLRDYTVRFSDADRSGKKTFQKGDCHWHEAGTHELENVGPGTVEFLVVHFKPDADPIPQPAEL
jgi:uncharacterized protein (TIGR03067 family)